MDAIVRKRMWYEERDVPVVREAFRKLCAECAVWPSPARFLEYANAVTPTATYAALPPPSTIPKTPEARREHLNQLLGDLDANA